MNFFPFLQTVLLNGCRTQVILKPVSLKAILTLAIRLLVSGNFTENLMSMFLVQILSMPALVHHLEQYAVDSLQSLQTNQILQRTLTLLETEQSLKIITNSMQGTQSLALLANIVHLFYLESPANTTSLGFPSFTVSVNTVYSKNLINFSISSHQFVCMRLLQSIPNQVGRPSGAVSQYHELLGWFSPTDAPKNENLSLVKKQIFLLWSHRIVKQLLVNELKELTVGYEKVEFPNHQIGSTSLFKRALERNASKYTTAASGGSKPWRKIGSNEITRIAIVCEMYYSALNTLSQLKLDILSGLCYNHSLLHDLFLLLASLGPNCGLKGLLELLSVNTASTYTPPLLMLLLFCDLMTHYVT